MLSHKKGYLDMEHTYYDVRFMFVYHSYHDGEIELCEGVTAFVADKEFYESVKLFDLPNVGDIMKVPGTDILWVVSCVIRRPELALNVFPSTAIILLCDYNLYVHDYFPNLYVGFTVGFVGLVGVIGPDRIFKALRSTEESNFTWGYIGGGPGHLSRAILFHRLGEMPDKDLVLDFEKSFIATLPKDKPFVIKARQIDEWINSRE